MSATLKFDGDKTTLVVETALEQVGNFAYEYDAAYLRDQYIITPKYGCDIVKFVEEARAIQAAVGPDVQVVIERFPLPKAPTGPAW